MHVTANNYYLVSVPMQFVVSSGTCISPGVISIQHFPGCTISGVMASDKASRVHILLTSLYLLYLYIWYEYLRIYYYMKSNKNQCQQFPHLWHKYSWAYLKALNACLDSLQGFDTNLNITVARITEKQKPNIHTWWQACPINFYCCNLPARQID